MAHLYPVFGSVTAPPRRCWWAWVDAEPTLAGLDRWQLPQILIGRDKSGLGDQVLAALARLARGGDDEAGRVLVAALGPALGRLAGLYAATLGLEEATAIAVAAVWDRVARYGPPPCHVAYRLVWLAGRRVHRAAVDHRTRSAQIATLDNAVDVGVDTGLHAGLLLGEAVGAGVVGVAEAWLLEATDVHGVDLRAAARRLGIGYEAAKKRRQRATAALGDWWDEPPVDCDQDGAGIHGHGGDGWTAA